MKKPVQSFRSRLFVSHLAGSLIPLLLCSLLLLQVFRVIMSTNDDREAKADLTNLCASLEDFGEKTAQALTSLAGNATIRNALCEGPVGDTRVNNILFSTSDKLRDFSAFELYNADGEKRYTTRDSAGLSKLSVSMGVLAKAQRARGEIIYYACENGSGGDGPLYQVAAAIENTRGEPVGYAVASLFTDDFSALLNNCHSADNTVVLLNSFWHSVYTSGVASEQEADLRAVLLSGKKLNADSDRFRYSVAVLAVPELVVVLCQPRSLSAETVRLMYLVSALSALISIGISVMISLRMSRLLVAPVERLESAFVRLENNDLQVRVLEQGQDELARLSGRFNAMVAALERNQETLLENERELNEAQIRMLQAQLNPHFLCNTLDTMKWISKINRVPQLAEMSTDLADILRFCITPEEFVTLAKETEILERYIEIQRIRLSDKFSFYVDMPDELENCLVPKMILQPLVENAILHGVDGMDHGEISVVIQPEEGDKLRITVIDNGAGFPEHLLGWYRNSGKNNGGHVGLYNVNTILIKYYGEASTLQLSRGPAGAGASVSTILPQRREKPDNENPDS